MLEASRFGKHVGSCADGSRLITDWRRLEPMNIRRLELFHHVGWHGAVRRVVTNSLRHPTISGTCLEVGRFCTSCGRSVVAGQSNGTGASFFWKNSSVEHDSCLPSANPGGMNSW